MRYLVVGAGFSGAVIARELAEAGHQVVIIDKRNHIAGNAHDYIHEMEGGGVRVHTYGPHLFHTNNTRVFEYLSRFTNWLPYKHKVKALLDDGRFATLPVNRETKEMVGEKNIVNIFIRPYTEKMWGMKLEELDPNIMNRVPVRDDDNEFYFPDDKYQYLPDGGYTQLVSRMLTHPNIRIELGVKFEKCYEHHYDHVFNSMPIDEYYNYQYGELPYRSIYFHNEIMLNSDADEHFPTATVNFTNNSSCTRKTNWSKLPGHGNNPKWTVVTHETPCDYKDNNLERYYPVKDIHGINRSVYENYKAIPNEKVTFIGRTGLYAYLDMHQAVNIALQTVKKFLGHEDENLSDNN